VPLFEVAAVERRLGRAYGLLDQSGVGSCNPADRGLVIGVEDLDPLAGLDELTGDPQLRALAISGLACVFDTDFVVGGGETGRVGVAVSSLLFQMDDVANKVAEGTIWRGVSQQVKSPENLSLILQNEIQIETIGVTASRKITYRHPDPKFAVKLLMLLRKADDQIIRTSIKSETENKIEWLKTEFQKTLNPDHRNALVQLLMSEERRRMLLSLETPYAVNVVEEASASPKPVTPNRPFIFLMMCLVGGFCGSVAALILGHKS
jgi:hypothetical protein